MRENRLSGGVGGVAGNSRHPDPISRLGGLRYDCSISRTWGQDGAEAEVVAQGRRVDVAAVRRPAV